jgi:ubiquinone biosynthesis protein Coq4
MSALGIARSFIRLTTRPEERAQNGTAFVVATEGSSFLRSFERFRETPHGARMLAQQPDIHAILRDKSTLRRCRAGSLGYVYATHMEKEALEEDFYAAQVAAIPASEAAQRWFRIRAGGMHDINHLMTGYSPTPLGEACLFCFRFAQLRHYGLLMLVVLLLVGEAAHGRFNPRAVIESYRRGKAARLLDLLPWEDDLEKTLAEHRAWLGLRRPVHFAGDLEPDAYFPA